LEPPALGGLDLSLVAAAKREKKKIENGRGREKLVKAVKPELS
jgi:hypothetical protein